MNSTALELLWCSADPHTANYQVIQTISMQNTSSMSQKSCPFEKASFNFCLMVWIVCFSEASYLTVITINVEIFVHRYNTYSLLCTLKTIVNTSSNRLPRRKPHYIIYMVINSSENEMLFVKEHKHNKDPYFNRCNGLSTSCTLWSILPSRNKRAFC